MSYIFHPAKDRGFQNHGWLETAHSFSFANYYDPNKMGFGGMMKKKLKLILNRIQKFY